MLLVGSGQDRLLPSLTEQTRLQRLLPNAQRLVLPDSGHTALLEVLPSTCSTPFQCCCLHKPPLVVSVELLLHCACLPSFFKALLQLHIMLVAACAC